MGGSHFFPVYILHRVHIQPHLHRQIRKYLLGFYKQLIQEIIIKFKKQFICRAVPFGNANLFKAVKGSYRAIIFVYLFQSVIVLQIFLKTDPFCLLYSRFTGAILSRSIFHIIPKIFPCNKSSVKVFIS